MFQSVNGVHSEHQSDYRLTQSEVSPTIFKNNLVAVESSLSWTKS